MLRCRRQVALLAAAVALGSAGSASARPSREPSALDACIDAAEAAQSESQQGRLLAARADTATCLDVRCPATIRRDCDALAAELGRRIPRIVVRVRATDGRWVPEANVQLDGQPLPLDGRAHELDPGPHELVARQDGFLAARERVVVEEGATARIIELRLAATPSPPLATSRKASTASSMTRTTRTASIGFAGLGLAGLGIFTGLALTTDADYRRLRGACEPTCSSSERDSVHLRFQIADVALGVGLVATAAAVVVYFFGPRRATTAAALSR